MVCYLCYRFTEYCPTAVENFVKLCNGAETWNYQGCPIHRIVKNGWIQCGDIVDGSGLNSIAVLDKTQIVPDESFSVDFGFFTGGILGYANSGAHSSGSQFFITLGPCEWMNQGFVGFGRVLQGYNVLRTLNTIPTSNQRPNKSITVASCGSLTMG